MSFYSRVKSYFPALLTLTGAGLILSAWTLTSKLDWKYQFYIYYSSIALWVAGLLAALLWYARKPLPLPAKLRFTLVASLFVLSVLPFQAARFWSLTAQTFSAIGLCLLLPGLLRWRRIHPWCAKAYRLLLRQRRVPESLFAGIFAALFLATTLFICWYCFSLVPSYTDSTAQYIHAKFVASGHLFSIPGHKYPDFFPVWLMVHGATWYSQYPPMHQTLLGIAMYLGAPWLLNPLEGMGVLLMIHAISLRLYGRGTARLAVLLTLLCQFLLSMAGEYMNHMTALFFGTTLMYSYLRMLEELPHENPNADREKLHLWALAAGASAGAAFLTRPLTAVGVSLPFMIHAFYSFCRRPRDYAKPCLFMAGGGLFFVFLQLWYNRNTTGEWLTYAYTRYHSNSFVRAMGYSPEGTLTKTIEKLHGDWALLNVMLFEWGVPCVLFFSIAFLLPMRDRATRLIAAVPISHTLTNMLNQFYSTVFGPRYLFEATAALIIITSVVIMRIPALLRIAGFRGPGGDAGRGMAAVMMLIIMTPAITNRVPNNLRIYSHYMDSHVPFYYTMLKQAEKPALIFLGRNETVDPMNRFRWMSWTYPPDDKADIIFARDLGDARNRKLIDYYSNRHAYVFMEEDGLLHPAKSASPDNAPSGLPPVKPNSP